MKTHDKEFFYKYVTADTAVKILKNKKVLCSSPECFNDPFDSQFSIQFDSLNEDELRNRFLDSFANLFGINTDVLNTEESKEIIFKGSSFSEQLKIMCSKLNSNLKEISDSDRIFCVSETFDNLLMWGHYSDNHEGAVIRFKCIPGDYAFNLAQKVIYSKKMPKLLVEDLLADCLSPKHLIAEKITLEMLLTKSIDWAYEKEWRIILGQLNPLENKELRGIDPKEIDGVYLGCKMSQEHEDQVKKIVTTTLDHVKLYKAEKNQEEFKLNFKEI